MVFRILFLICFFTVLLAAQQNDTLPAFTTSTIVVTADRSENIISNSTSSVSVVSSNELRSIPGRSYLDALSSAGGIFTMYTGGTYNNPVVSPRGYYGGGEADYALLLVNGVPLNNTGTGLAEWNLIPPEYINRLEILHGGSSVLYGDAAMGGIINLFTPDINKENIIVSIRGGSYDYYKGFIGKSGKKYSLYVSPESSGGFRKHGSTGSVQFGGNTDFALSPEDQLSFSTFNMLAEEDSPGPLSLQDLSSDRKISSVYYHSDGRDKRIFNITGSFRRLLSAGSDVSLTAQFKNNKFDITRTTINAAPIMDLTDFSIIGVYDTSFYGDTKIRQVSSNELFLGLKYITNIHLLNLKLVAGSDFTSGKLNSEHYDYFSGFEEDYKNRFVENKKLVIEGRNTRTNYSFYFNNEFGLLKHLKLVLGLRYDKIENELAGIKPDTSIQTSADALSPKAGLNLQFAQRRSYSGNIFVNYNRSFKSPTADQLTDLSQLNSVIFVPSGAGYEIMPFSAAPFSNSELKPQTADNFEAGVYQKFLLSERTFADVSLAGYLTRIKDEIDFDLNTFRYQNIHKTKHSGFEGSVKLISGDWNIFMNYALNRVTFDEGELSGNNLKGIPQSVSSIGLLNDDVFGFSAGIVFHFTGKIYLDDENTKEINGYSSTDVKLGYKTGIISLSIMASNVFDERYNYNGFLLSGREFYYPAAGRVLTGEVRVEIQ